ncbi:hypothetical protein SAMN05444161_0114 [Rhizobiales bacterium GAS191]|nr:hypothetical protein SAMN05444161_0114 [Rhizobiales bacterium GAS191]SED27310.1 hypothetical protein SAMN05519104_3193 [Rhizobiales bacterium GAS188]
MRFFTRVLAGMIVPAFVAACQQTGTNSLQVSANQPVGFHTGIRTHSPDPGKWAFQRVDGRDEWKCRPLACADNGVVSITMSKNPTPHPDPVALANFAKGAFRVSLEAQGTKVVEAGGKITATKVVSTSVDKVRGYHALRYVNELSGDNGTVQVVGASIFVGALLVKVSSASTSLATARKNFDDFTHAMEIDDQAPN